MESLKKIPVVGYFFRMLYAMLKLPKHLDVIYQKNEYFDEQNKLLKKEQERLEQEKEQLKQGQEQLKQGQEQLKQGQEQLKQGQEPLRQGLEQLREEEEKAQSELQQWKNMQQAAVDELRRWNYDRMDDIRRVQDVIGELQQALCNLQQLHVGEDYIKRLNWLLSAFPTVWGEESRLHISDLAAVSACMFNTNSGHITVGDYTFAGSGVSILAGSHDMRLTGLLRRDVEMTEGCDITIGKGVWLASNCTILGPATIGDNAVVAAGAVVTPRTCIPPNTIYGGVPAKFIGEIELVESEDVDNSVILKTLERSNGILYVKGWTEKRVVAHEGKSYVGHFLCDELAEIYMMRERVEMFYQCRGTDNCTLVMQMDNDERRIYSLEKTEGILQIEGKDNKSENQMVHRIVIINPDKDIKIFLATIN